MPGLKGQSRILFIVLMMGCSFTRPMIKIYSKPKMPEESFLPWKKGHRDSAWSMWPNASYLHPPCDLGWKKEHRRSVHPARITPWNALKTHPFQTRAKARVHLETHRSWFFETPAARCPEAAARRKVKQSEISNQLAKKNLGSMLDPKWNRMSFYFMLVSWQPSVYYCISPKNSW